MVSTFNPYLVVGVTFGMIGMAGILTTLIRLYAVSR